MTDEAGRLAVEALEELKGQNIVAIDVMALSDVMDCLVIASGTSSRHVKSLASNVIESLKKQGLQPIGVEGMVASDWVLVDYGTCVVHVMLEPTRQFYDLEKLWTPIEGIDESIKGVDGAD